MRTYDLTPFYRSTVGFDRLFDLMDSYAEQSNGYPPYNIERSDETHYRVTLAVAGFGEKDRQDRDHRGRNLESDRGTRELLLCRLWDLRDADGRGAQYCGIDGLSPRPARSLGA